MAIHEKKNTDIISATLSTRHLINLVAMLAKCWNKISTERDSYLELLSNDDLR